MTDEQQNAIDNLRSNNFELSTLVKDAVKKSIEKSVILLEDIEDPNELLTTVKVIETASKIVGLTPKETQTNIQINAINGFDFIEIDEEDIRQIDSKETFAEAEIEHKDEEEEF